MDTPLTVSQASPTIMVTVHKTTPTTDAPPSACIGSTITAATGQVDDLFSNISSISSRQRCISNKFSL